MFSTEHIYIFCICLLLLICTYLVRKLYQFSVIILNMESAVEESLDILNERYGSIFEITQRPVFFDSVEVRQVISDIKKCHDAVLIVANKLTNEVGVNSEIEEKNKGDNIKEG